MSEIRVEDPPPTAERDDAHALTSAPAPRPGPNGLVIDLRNRETVGAPDDFLVDLPSFPLLSPIRHEHLRPIRAMTAGFDDYSDFNATSLWGWSGSVDGGHRVGRHGDNLIVELADYLSGERFLSFLGTDHVDETAESLLREAEGSGAMAPELRLVPEVTARLLDDSCWTIVEDLAAADYVYLAEDAATAAGSRYRSLRYSHNAWDRRWRSRSRIEWLDQNELYERRQEVLSLFDSWRRRESSGSEQSRQELLAVSHLLETLADTAPGIDGWSGICTTDGEVTAAFINEREDQQRLCGHFLKMTDRPCGDRFYGWFFLELCRKARADGIKYVNLQQDLGIPGLRAAKEQLRPYTKLRKFTVKRRRT